MTKKTTAVSNKEPESDSTPTIDSVGWTDYVLSLLADDEKIAGNPTTDGLRRIFESVLNCTIIYSKSTVIQSPEINNEKRATVVHELGYHVNDKNIDDTIKLRSVSGAADVYWGNCDKIYRNHPVAVAETRAEGRALRRALRLKKVVAAEELAKDVEDDVNGNSVSKISNNQINFIDVIAKRIDIDILKLIDSLGLEISNKNVYGLSHDSAVTLITKLSDLQRNVDAIENAIKGYDPSWK